jgi:leader peptidase (prepilin peptidase)/N-methyltransferase
MSILFSVLLITAGILDARSRKIPDIFPLLIAALGILRLFLEPAGAADHVLGMLILSVPMLLLTLRFGGLGGGDIKLVAASGLFLGVHGVTMGVLLAGLLALLAMGLLSLLRLRSRTEPFPFGPFLAAGFVLGMLVQG